MRYILFMILTLTSVLKCTGAQAYELKIKLETCTEIVGDIRKMAWDDADAFDMESLEEQGTVRYMCMDDDAPESPELIKLCKRAMKLGCK